MAARTLTARSAPSRRHRLASRHATRAFLRWLGRGTVELAGGTLGFAVAIAVLALASLGRLRGGGASEPVALALLAGLGALLLVRLAARFREAADGMRPRSLADLELGTMFVAGTFAVVEVAGGPGGLVYPLVYGLVAFLVAFHGGWLSAYFLVLIAVTEASLTLLGPPEAGRLLVSHLSFNLLFALLSALFLRTEVVRRRSRTAREVAAYLEGIQNEAQEYRLTSGSHDDKPELAPDERATRRQVSSVEAIRQALYNVLAVAERALAPYTVALLWLDNNDQWLTIRELRSQSDHIVEKRIGAGEGFLGAVTKRREPLALSGLKPGHPGLVYYDRAEPVTDFAAVPVLEDDTHLRGVLVADRTTGRPFDGSDLAVMTTIAGEIVRAVQVEHVFADMDRDRYQKERFYEASRELNQALNVREVAQTAIRSARRVAQVDFAAVAVSLEEENGMRLEAVDWVGHDEVAGWVGRDLRASEGLVGAAIKARHDLPVGTARAASQSVFGPGVDLPLPAVKVFPMIARKKGVGALVVASERESFLAGDTRDMLLVIADHTGIALANAQLFEHNERLATTDGLTGLFNHRHFQHLFDHVLAQAERYGRKLSVLLTDIDHFKSVNDTYGHPVGDKVLVRVAAVMAQTARAKIDVVARYGGEEFAVILPETDRAGALRLAERVRTRVAAEQFHTENGRFKATISLGVATFPDDATTKAKLIDCADQALYAAKHDGRNRSVTFDMLKSRREVSHSA